MKDKYYTNWKHVVLNSAPADMKLLAEKENGSIQDYPTSLGYSRTCGKANWPKTYTKFTTDIQ